MTTGDRIRLRRKEIGKSAEDIATQLGVSPATIYRYENGDIEKVPVDVVIKISKILSVSPVYLMGWSSEATETKKMPADASSADELTETQKYAFDMLKTMDDSEIKLLIDIFKTVRANRKPDRNEETK